MSDSSPAQPPREPQDVRRAALEIEAHFLGMRVEDVIDVERAMIRAEHEHRAERVRYLRSRFGEPPGWEM